MPKLSQKSFVSGQYDRIAQNQESINGGGIVASGLSYAKNVLSSDRGELRKRLGTKHLLTLPKATVLVPFRMNDENDVILAIDDEHVTGYKYVDGELQILQSLSPQSAIAFPAGNTWGNGTNGALSITNGDWVLSSSLFGNSYPGYLMNRTGFNEGYPAKSAPQSITFYNSSTPVCMRSIKLKFWTMSGLYYQYHNWSNPVIQYSDDGTNWTGVQTDYVIDEKVPRGCVDISGIGYTCFTTNSGTATQMNYSGAHQYWRVFFPTGNLNTDDHVVVQNVSFVNPATVTDFQQTSPYVEEQLKKVKYTQDVFTNKNTMFIACEGVIPYKLSNNTGELTWGSFTPTNPNTLWSSKGYPAAVSLFQNRLWFGGFENFPTTVIASKFDDYDTFTPSSPLQKDDSLDLRCNQLSTRIRNLTGGQSVMYCFSNDGISNIDGGSTGLLATNENIEFKLKNRMPAGDATPAFKDDIMLYSSSDGTKLYGVDFDLLVNRFQVSDLAIYAKDITQEKITELHYVNNESKLVYGLTESGKMFALLYEKGAYQGFFPMDFNGTVYDIVPIKVGRNYKLLMVVFRDENWYLEEKLDCGKYIDTSTPRLTDEEKKWATYDNLENNIALDCYQTYDMGIDAISNIAPATGNVVTGVATQQGALTDTGEFTTEGNCEYKMVSDDSVVQQPIVDAYLTTDFIPVKAGGVYTMDDAVNNEYYNTIIRVCAYDGNYNYIEDVLHDIGVLKTEAIAGHRATFTLTMPDNAEYVRIQYFNLDTPILVGEIPDAIALTFDTDVALEVGKTAMLGNIGSEEWVVVNVESKTDNRHYIVSVESNRGNPTEFTKVYPEFTQFAPNLPRDSRVAVVSEGRYFNTQTPDENGNITLPAPCHKIIYGVPYESVAIIKLQAPYESLKNIAQVDLSVINSTHLEVGTNFEDTQNIEKIDDSSYYDLTRITMNDTYRLVLSDTPETTKNLILRSNKGVPFTVIAIDMYINYSNLGGD